MATDIPATPVATTCKANLDAAAAQFATGGIAAVTQIAGATISNYVSILRAIVDVPSITRLRENSGETARFL